MTAVEPFPLRGRNLPPRDPQIVAMASNACRHLSDVPGLTSDAKQVAAEIVFSELHALAIKRPMGAAVSDDEHERQIRRDLREVKESIENDSEKQKQIKQTYGIDPVSIIMILSSLFSIVKFIRQWLRGEI